MNGVQTRFKCKLDVKRCKRFVFPPSSLLPRSNALKTKAIRYFQTDRTLTRIVSPPLYTLKRKPQDAKIFDLARIAQDIEALGAMSAEDVEHVGKAIVRQMRQTLTDGNSVRLDGFGIFHTTFKCRATELAKDCTVKNIERVNIRFKVANTLRLVNDSNATTKGGANNLIFELVTADKDSTGGGSSGNNPDGGGSDGDQGENPLG